MEATLYDFPQYYELAFSFRRIADEVDFVESCLTRYSAVPVTSVLEIACGPAPHAGELVRRGYRYIGLDINDRMLAYARDKWRIIRPRPQFFHADMVNFRCPEPCDFAFVMLGSLYLDGPDDLRRHFDCLARALRPGALYFMDLCVQFADPLARQLSNVAINHRDGVTVESRFDSRLIDAARQLYEETWIIDVSETRTVTDSYADFGDNPADDTPPAPVEGHRKRFRMVERNRAIFPQEFLLFLNSRDDFEFVGWWEDWDFSLPIEGAAAPTRPLILVRRR